MSAIRLSARVVAQISARRELLQALLEWAAGARREPGLRSSHVDEDVEAPAAFHLAAEWESAAALEAHLRSDPFGVLLGALELLTRSTRVTVTKQTDDYGADALKTIRRLREARGPAAGR